MSKLGKYVCLTYICLAIVLGGVSAYFKFTFDQMNLKAMAQEDNNKNNSNNTTEEDEIIKNSTPIEAELTAYCNCKICSEAWGSQTAMQTHTRVGIIAVPKDIQLGSKIYIPDLKDYKEDGIFEAEDRGGAVIVKNDGTHIIDVWLKTHEEVKEFGRKKTKVYLINNK
ncbi:3D domain-containing protein [Clostridium sp. C2-6-12]|uniref:3D domain-containing protein n=1 Tax=Clostridium sp. C2-6-12 TaxID=2698832 RepID=UPI00136B3927|nr:3D domain-containing protein [Clostridium sp. C2-6-12]